MINSGDIIRTACQWKFAGTDDQVNVLHWRCVANTAASPAEELEDIAQILTETFVDVTPYISSVLTHFGVAVQNVTQAAILGDTGAIPALDGDGGSDALPPQTTGLLLMRTSVSRVQGRIYLPSFSNIDNNDGVISSGAVVAMNGVGSLLLGDIAGDNGLTLRYVVWRGGLAYAQPISRAAVTRYRTQRRRTAGRGS